MSVIAQTAARLLCSLSLYQMAGPLRENLQPQRVRIELCAVLSKAAETMTAEFAQRLNQRVAGVGQ